jgi:hypothetical protein
MTTQEYLMYERLAWMSEYDVKRGFEDGLTCVDIARRAFEALTAFEAKYFVEGTVDPDCLFPVSDPPEERLKQIEVRVEAIGKRYGFIQ